jgi:hydrogenase maturation protein HypF
MAGWVRNGADGVEIHLEGPTERVDAFLRDLRTGAPAPAAIAAIEVREAAPGGLADFVIRGSRRGDGPTAGISPDLATCAKCIGELFDPRDRRHRYPYLNCTECGPRYSIVLGLPYDRVATTMAAWTMDDRCSGEYHNPADRRFHAQPTACPTCGPHYRLESGEDTVDGDVESVHRAAQLLGRGAILALKGIGGYHLACDARNSAAVGELRARKFRKEKPFALMARDLDAARRLCVLTPQDEALLASVAAPIVLARAREALPHVAPDSGELGIMLPYAPLHHLLFASDAPDVLVMTSANHSSEPIAYEDADARRRLAGLADAFLVGERPIARRVEDSVARVGPLGPTVLRRSRGYAPAAVAAIPFRRPILALGADLKNTVTLVVEGQAFMSQHIGDLEHHEAGRSFSEAIRDLLSMYGVLPADLLLAHDCHPEYRSTVYALELGASERWAVQHHRAHVASVLAERGAWSRRVLGISFDGTGYGDDGTIWGGEFFVGSIDRGLDRVAHLRPAMLVGGDAAVRHPTQAAAGFLAQLDGLPDLCGRPFGFPGRYGQAMALLRSGSRILPTTSAGRLFDTAAALLGFVRPVSYEGQAAMWLEQLAREAPLVDPLPFPYAGGELDWRPLLRGVVDERRRGRDRREIARAFQAGVARGLCDAARHLCGAHGLDTIVASGGVFQNGLLVEDLLPMLRAERLELWINHVVPPNDGGISLGQAALAALQSCTSSPSH